jgi:hypothetical protein
MEIRVGDQTVALGEKVYIPSEGEITISVDTKGKGLVQAVELRPAPEGDPIAQAEDGTILLHARDATVHGTKLRYEREPHKNTLGYWSQVTDYAAWTFTATKPGRFNVIVRQGCGKGSGGSEATVKLADQTIDFTVEDTGGWQNWKDRSIGELTIKEVGETTLLIRANVKAKNAVMDVQQITLVPVE